MEDLWKLLHALSGFGLVAGLIGRTITVAEARRTEDLGKIDALMRAAGRFESILVQPMSFVVLVLGLITMWAQGRSLVGEGNRWLLTSLLIYVGIGALVPLVFLPRGRRFEAAMQEATSQGQVTPALREAFADPVVAVARNVELVAILVIIALMVLKPF